MQITLIHQVGKVMRKGRKGSRIVKRFVFEDFESAVKKMEQLKAKGSYIQIIDEQGKVSTKKAVLDQIEATEIKEHNEKQ